MGSDEWGDGGEQKETGIASLYTNGIGFGLESMNTVYQYNTASTVHVLVHIVL